MQRYTDARQVALQGIKELGASPGSAAMFASIARAAIICGNEDAAALNLKRARKILSQEADFSEAKLSSCSAAVLQTQVDFFDILHFQDFKIPNNYSCLKVELSHHSNHKSSVRRNNKFIPIPYRVPVP